MSVIEVKIPNVAESITEVTLASWLVADGDVVEMDQALCEVETDKAGQELYAEAAGKISLISEEGDDIKVGETIAKIDTSAQSSASSVKSNQSSENSENPSDEKPKTEKSEKSEKQISPVAANILAEKGIAPDSIKGTGTNGKITKDDALKATQNAGNEENKENKEESSKPQTPNTKHQKGERNQRRERLSRLRKTVAKRLVAVKNETAMLTTFNEVDMKPIKDLRAKYKEKFGEKYDIGLGFMSFFTKAVCLALQEFPQVNAMIDGDEVIFHDYCDISIAVSAPKGLVVPVIRNAENLSLAEIEKEVKRLALRARNNELSMDEMTGGTFSITNGGVFGSMLSTPIINPPQSAILGMHNIVDRPVAVNGQVEIRPIMYLALSYDHRIIDGRESVSFLYRVKEYLEDPARMLLGI